MANSGLSTALLSFLICLKVLHQPFMSAAMTALIAPSLSPLPWPIIHSTWHAFSYIFTRLILMSFPKISSIYWLSALLPRCRSGKESACQFRRCKRQWVRSLGQEDTLEKEMAILSSFLTWKIPWTEEPGRLQSKELQMSCTWLSTPSTHTYWFYYLLKCIEISQILQANVFIK